MASYDDLADLMPSASPLASAGIDPDDAVANREQVMAQLAAKQNGMTHPVANTSGTIPELVAAAPTPSWLSGATAPAVAPKGPPATNAPTPASEPPSAPSVPGVVTPSGNSSTPTPNYYQAGQAGALDSATAAQGNARRWQSRPLPSATTDPIEDKIEAASTPTQGRDAQGNLLPQYRPSVGQRIVRGVQGFAQNGLRGVLTAPYGAPNDAYQGQEAQRQAQLAAMRQRLQYRQGANAADQTAMKEIGTADTNVGSRFDAVATAANQKQTADAATQNAATNATKEGREAYNESPEAKAATSDMQLAQANKKADALGLKGMNRILFLANGKIPDPRQPTDDEIATHQATQIFTQQNGHPPQTLEEFNEVRRSAKGADKQVDKDGKPLPTVADKNRASLAHVANDNINQIEDIVNRRPELFGAGGGRVSNIDQMIGSNDPDLVAVGNAVHNFAMANAGIHGSRSHENVRDAENEFINNMKSGPQGIRGAITSNRQNLKSIIDRVEGGGGKGTADADHDIVVNPEDIK